MVRGSPESREFDNMATNFSNFVLSDRFRNSPLGTTGRLSSGPGTPQFNRATAGTRALERDYNTALRALRRQSRNTSGGLEGRSAAAKAAVGLVELRERALARGLQPGGIRSSEGRRADDLAEVQERAYQIEQNQQSEAAMNAAAATDVATPISASSTTFVPQTRLGGFASRALSKVRPALDDATADPLSASSANEYFRPGLDRALGQASTEQEVEELRTVAGQAGINETDFNRRADWWKRRRTVR